MDSLSEEKKELESVEEKNFEHEARGDDWEGASGDEELVDLPAELSGLSNKTYEFLDDLEQDMKNHGFPDLFVVLDPKTRKPRLRITTGAHDKITDSFAREFNEHWGKNRWGAASESTNVFIQPLPGRKPTRRKPDIAFWGYGKCVLNENGTMFPKDLDSPPKLTNSTSEQTERVNPDVVFQFSWGNSFGYEKNAINDMMNRALVMPQQPNNEAPKLGFLVKVRTGSKRCSNGRRKLLRIDVFRIPCGTTVADAEASRNGSSKASYVPGQKDVVVEVSAKDLGIEGFWATFCCSSFKISAREIYELLE